MAANRERALDAAIALLADEGIRSLTHLRVDDRAGLPRGSTSNAFRTRRALLLGVCERMAEQELPAIALASAASTEVELADALVALFDFFVGPGRQTTAARLVLIVEAGRDDQARAALARGRGVVEGPVREAFATLGSADPALAVQLVATCFEGLFLHVLGRHAEVDAGAVIAAAVRAGLAGRPPQ